MGKEANRTNYAIEIASLMLLSSPTSLSTFGFCQVSARSVCMHVGHFIRIKSQHENCSQKYGVREKGKNEWEKVKPKSHHAIKHMQPVSP